MSFQNMRTANGVECNEGKCYGRNFIPNFVYNFEIGRSVSKFNFIEPKNGIIKANEKPT